MSETKRVRADELKPGDTILRRRTTEGRTVKSVQQINRMLARITFCDGKVENIASDWTVDVIAPDPRDALIERLRTELASCHKVVIDAMAVCEEAGYMAVVSILDTAPEPDDETLRLIEARDEQLNQVWVDQADRLNDGWAHPNSGAKHVAYQQIEFLLKLCDPNFPGRHKDTGGDDAQR